MANTNKELLISFKNGVKTIKINRPKSKNAFNVYIYKTIASILTEDSQNDEIVLTILTGTGDYFSSGNDLKASLTLPPEEAFSNVEKMINSFIKYPKLLIAVVNGPAIGIGATILGLCDIVYATEDAYIHTPFVKMGLCAEGCSSYSFPRIMGRSKASEMILLGEKIVAEDAYRFGLVSRVIEHRNVDKFIEELHRYGGLSVNGIKVNKKLIMKNLDTILCECNSREIGELPSCIESDDFNNAIVKFMNSKSKL